MPFDQRRVIDSRRLRQRQHVHAAITAVAGFGGVLAAVWLAVFVHPPSIFDWLLLGCFYLPIQLGVTAGLHRHFSHRSFCATRKVRQVLAALGSMAGQGPVVFWVSLHRLHHELSDRSGDPHSPNLAGSGRLARLRGIVHAYVGWTVKHEVPNANHYARDLLREASIMSINRTYYYWVALGLLLPSGIAGLVLRTWTGVAEGLIWGGLVRMFLGHNMIWWITSFAHVIGTREFDSKDRSTNNRWLALPTLGESWHNNHHAFPGAARLNFSTWQLDLTGLTIGLLERCGLAWNVRRPEAPALAARRLTAAGARLKQAQGPTS